MEDGRLSDLLVTAVLCCVLAILFVRLSIPVLVNRLPDLPNERSSHTKPVPRGGGIGVMLAIWAGLLVFGPAGGGAAEAGLLLSTVILAVVSVVDDARPLPAAVRFVLQAGVVVIALYLAVDVVPMPAYLPYGLVLAVAGLGWIWFINLYNFMDGIDGISSIETISVGAGTGIVWWLAGMPANWSQTTLFAVAAAGAMAGFLVWNRHPARIFLGDVGSIPLGFMLGAALLWMALYGHPEAAVILPLYYLADATITLLKRLFRGEKVWLAHREHFYQRASNEHGRGPVAVVRVIAVTNTGLIGCAAYSVNGVPGVGLLVAVALVCGLLFHLNRQPH